MWSVRVESYPTARSSDRRFGVLGGASHRIAHAIAPPRTPTVIPITSAVPAGFAPRRAATTPSATRFHRRGLRSDHMARVVLAVAPVRDPAAADLGDDDRA